MTTHAHDELLHTARVHAYQPNISDEASKKICKGYLEQRSQISALTKQLEVALEALSFIESSGETYTSGDGHADCMKTARNAIEQIKGGE